MNCALLFEKHSYRYMHYMYVKWNKMLVEGGSAAQVDSRLAIAVKQ